MAASGKLDLVRGDSHLAGNLLDGSLEGPLRIDEHDRPQASLGYRQGQLHGASTLFHPNGKVSAQLAFVDGKLHGPVSFHAAEGWLQRKAHYRNGLLHGEALTYFANGQVAEREHYRDGVRDGVYQRFHGNGQLAFDGRYLNGQLLDGAQPFADNGQAAGQRGQAHGALALVVDQAGGALGAHRPGGAQGISICTCPGTLILITPPQVQISVPLASSAGIPPSSRVGGPPGIHGLAVAGMHGIGVSTPRAAAVAAATTGLAGLWQRPKVGMFSSGMWSMMFAAGIPLVRVRFCGNTLSTVGAAPKLHCRVAPAQTCGQPMPSSRARWRCSRIDQPIALAVGLACCFSDECPTCVSPAALEFRCHAGRSPATGIDEKGFSADRTVPAAPSPACGRSMQGLPHPGRPQGRDDNA